jgi:chemotaxis protein methyltransferase CheR
MCSAESGVMSEQGFDFSPADFERVRGLIHARAGISLNPSKRNMVYSRLIRRLRVLGHADFKSYLDTLEAGPANAAEWQEFINSLTTNLTSFFREPHHFPVVADLALEHARRHTPVRVWCCAASTGEEPYSLAITMMEAFKTLTPPVSILATDIDTSVLAKAQRGVYAMDTVSKLEPSLLKRYFLRGRGAQEGWARVRPEVQALVSFRPMNLLDESWPQDSPYDAIFCRNVMIYFDKPTQIRILHRLATRLRDDGLLFVGHSENFSHGQDLFELQGKTVYRMSGRARRSAA